VFVGIGTVRSRILPEGEEDPPTEKGTCYDVPFDYFKDFDSDLSGSIRDILGQATQPKTPWLHHHERIEDCLDRDRVHPFSLEESTLWDGGRFFKSLLVQRNEKAGQPNEQEWLPLLHPRARRTIHLDYGMTKDAAGLTMAHTWGCKSVLRLGSDGEDIVEVRPMHYVDFMLRVIPPRDGEIIAGDIRRLIYELRDMGFDIAFMTSDQFQSRDTGQQMAERGIPYEVLSVDAPEAYDALKDSINEWRLSMYEYRPVITELLNLEFNRVTNHVDHPPKGHKDIADSLAGAVYNLERFKEFFTTVDAEPDMSIREFGGGKMGMRDRGTKT